MTRRRDTAKRPTVAIARALRDLGLKQGRDFNVRGHYRRGERRYTYVALVGNPACLVLKHAEQIAAQVRADGGWTLYVDRMCDGRAAMVHNSSELARRDVNGGA